MNRNYTPSPIDTSGIKLPLELISLSELLASNAHDIWAASRIEQGWSWGPARDDILKTNPDIVPYDDLPEVEKEYDRIMSQQTIKVILKLGFKILPPE